MEISKAKVPKVVISLGYEKGYDRAKRLGKKIKYNWQSKDTSSFIIKISKKATTTMLGNPIVTTSGFFFSQTSSLF